MILNPAATGKMVKITLQKEKNIMMNKIANKVLNKVVDRIINKVAGKIANEVTGHASRNLSKAYNATSTKLTNNSDIAYKILPKGSRKFAPVNAKWELNGKPMSFKFYGENYADILVSSSDFSSNIKLVLNKLNNFKALEVHPHPTSPIVAVIFKVPGNKFKQLGIWSVEDILNIKSLAIPVKMNNFDTSFKSWDANGGCVAQNDTTKSSVTWANGDFEIIFR